ncbi:MAG: hypothetical protein ACOYN4_08290 [Bacteroidales bacterium]
MSKHIESKKTPINCPHEKVYHFLGNFDNFGSLLPEQVSEWQSTGDSCSFEVKGLPKIGLRHVGKTPFVKISMKSEGKLPFTFAFDTHIEAASPQQCLVQLVIDSDMNPFIAVMAEKPLQNFVDVLLVKLKDQMEK